MTEEVFPPPPPSPPPLPPPAEANRPLLWLGAGLGIAPGLLALLIRSTDVVVVLFVVSSTLWPLLAVILAIVRGTRRFGLGMLLGMGLGWLILLAVCGGGLTRG